MQTDELVGKYVMMNMVRYESCKLFLTKPIVFKRILWKALCPVRTSEEQAWWYRGKVYFLEIEKVEKFSKAAWLLDEAAILKDLLKR